LKILKNRKKKKKKIEINKKKKKKVTKEKFLLLKARHKLFLKDTPKGSERDIPEFNRGPL